MSLAPGTRFGPYEVAEPIGKGGMGDVYRATDTNLKRDVALKVLPETFVADADRLARLQREAELLASLNHFNVAQIYGLEKSDGHTAIVMELVEGADLADRIAEGPLPPHAALDLALQIASALEAAHGQGIVHRDLKPANIKVKEDGTVKVLDFGLAKPPVTRVLSGPQPAVLSTPAMTEAGIVLGTAAYMSPEQARGKPVDKRADVWAFGCVLYEMLTGQPAFMGEDVTSTLARVLERDPDLKPLPRGLPPAVRGTLELCLQKDPKQRLRDMGDVKLALEGELAALAKSEPVRRLPFWRRVLPLATALLVGALVTGGYFANLGGAPAEPAAPQAPARATRFTITPPPEAPLANLGGYDVAVSPDGARIAYFALNPVRGSVSLYVRELDSLEARLVPGTEVASPSQGNMNPFFSADGRWIGFFSPERGVVRVSIDGAPPLKMLDSPSPAFLGASWQADDTLVYSSGRGLYRISAGGGGKPEPLMPERDDGTFVASPVPLPGGRAVLFGLITDVERVAALDLETGEQKILIEGGQNATYVDSGHIVFARGTTLMAAPFNAAELALTGEPVALLQGVRHPNSLTAADFNVSETGTLVYVPGGGESGAGSEVVWIDRSGVVSGRALPELIEAPRDPRLSPDGLRLLLTTGPPSDGDLWSYDLGGRPPIPLALAGDNRLAVWSPDGRRAAFAGRNGAGVGIFTIPADGSALAPEPLPDPLQSVPADWSDAGELVVVYAGSSPPDIGVKPATADAELRPLVATEFAEFDPARSPDGRWLAYASNRTGQPEIWVMRYPDGIAARVSARGGYEPRWSRDGRELFYLQGNSMMALPVETGDELSFGAPAQLFTGSYFANMDAIVRSYDVAHDGRFLMIQPQGSAGADVASSIVVVENWGEELRRRLPPRR